MNKFQQLTLKNDSIKKSKPVQKLSLGEKKAYLNITIL